MWFCWNRLDGLEGRIGMDDGGAREMIGKEEGWVDGKGVSQ